MRGRLRHQIVIESKTLAGDGMGGGTATWTTFATVRAAIEPISGSEYIAAQQMQTKVTHRIRLRYLANVTAAMRVKFGTRIFQIESILTFNEVKRDMQLMCSEQTEGA